MQIALFVLFTVSIISAGTVYRIQAMRSVGRFDLRKPVLIAAPLLALAVVSGGLFLLVG